MCWTDSNRSWGLLGDYISFYLFTIGALIFCYIKSSLLNDVLAFLSHRLLTEEAFIKEYSDSSKFHKSKGTEKGFVLLRIG